MIIAASVLLTSCFTAQAQNGESLPPEAEAMAPVPAYDNTVVYYNAYTNQIKQLEITRSETTTKGNGLSMLPIGGGGSKTNLVLQGGASPVVLPRDAAFIVRLGDEGANPNLWVMLYRLEQNLKKNPAKSTRFMTVSKMSGVGISVFSNYNTKSVSGESQQALRFKQVQPGVYRMQPAAPLTAGEYFFTVIDPDAQQSVSPMVYAFGVR